MDFGRRFRLPSQERERAHGSEDGGLEPGVLAEQDRDPARVRYVALDGADDLASLDVEPAWGVERDVVPVVVVPLG